MNAKRLTKCKTWKGMGVESNLVFQKISIAMEKFISVNAFRRLKTCLYFILNSNASSCCLYTCI